MKKKLILGAGGFIGKELCLKLAQQSEIVAYDIKIHDNLRKMKNVSFLERDFTNEQDFEQIIEDVDVVYHLISTTLPQERTDGIIEEIRDNVIPTVRLLEAMKNKHVNNIVFTSSAGTVYGETGIRKNKVTDKLSPICSYGVQKKVIETYLEFYGLKYEINYKIARISNPYGLGQDKMRTQGVIPIFINRLLKEQPIMVYGDGENKRDYLYMDDLVEAIKKLGEYKGRQHIFNIASGYVHSLHEIISSIENVAGKKFVQINYSPVRSFDVSNTILDIENTQKELKWIPDTDIYNGINKIYKGLAERKEK